MTAVDGTRWQHVDRIFEAALELPAADRLAFISREFGEDRELFGELRSLLEAHDRADGFLEHPGTLNPARTELVGQVIGKYRIVRPLGTGGAGEVYLAEDTRLARPVAVKLLAAHWSANQDHIRRFRREALAASALNHPNILTIHEIGEWQGRDFIAAEFVDGMTLRAYMRDRKPDMPELLDLALQIAGALAVAHSAGIVHRDIKPENIMVRPDGLAKLLDFGIVKQMDKPADPDTSMTASGVVVGTTAYMSPEQARGEAVDGRTDIWSLGVLIYEMAAGSIPFPGKTRADRLAAILEREPELLGKVRPGTPAKLEAIVRRALAKNRDQRYPDAAALADDLSQLRGEISGGRQWFKFASRALPVVITLLLAIAALVGISHFRSGPLAPDERIPSLAVLPLANAGSAADTEYLADGITDSLISGLSEIPQLKVMSHNSVLRFRGQDIDAQKVGQALNVRAVLSGRVAQRGGELSIALELADARDNSHIWGQHYERKLANIFDMQEEIARDVAHTLQVHLSKEERDRIAKRHTTSTEAYQLYVKGHFYALKCSSFFWSPEADSDLAKSRDFFQRAIDVDPGYALAYSGLGHYYFFAGGNLVDPDEAIRLGGAAIRKALALDPDLVDGRVGLAVIELFHRRDWTSAEREIRRTLALNPNYPGTHGLYSTFFLIRRRFDDAIAELRRAIELDPLSIRFSANLGRIYYYARRYDEAIRQYRHAIELEPAVAPIHDALGDANAQRGLEREAVAEWRTALALAGDNAAARMLGGVYANKGFAATVRALARRKLEVFSTRTKRGRFVPADQYAHAYSRLGQREQALTWLAKACDEHGTIILFLRDDPAYDELRADPRFQAIVKRLNLPQ